MTAICGGEEESCMEGSGSGIGNAIRAEAIRTRGVDLAFLRVTEYIT